MEGQNNSQWGLDHIHRQLLAEPSPDLPVNHLGNRLHEYEQELHICLSSPMDSQQQTENNNYNQITDNIPGSLDNITNQAGSGLQDEQIPNSILTILRFGLPQNDIPEQSVELEPVQNFRGVNRSLQPHVPESGNPSNEILQSQPQDLIVQAPPIRMSRQHYEGHNDGDQIRTQAVLIRSWKELWLIFVAGQKFMNRLKQGMVTITVPGFVIQIPSNLSFDDLKVEITTSILDNLCFDLHIQDQMTTCSNISTQTHSPDKQHVTLKRKHPQDAAVLHCTKKKVFKILNCASSPSPLSSSVQSQNHTRFTEDEIERLIKGVEECGVGDWLEIKRRFFNESSRTNRQLQDKWTNLVKAADLDPDAKKKKKKKKKSAKKFAEFYRRVHVVIEETHNQ